MRRIILDTNVVVSGMRSREGASYRLLLELGGESRFRIFVSVPLAMEYEMALKRVPGLRPTDAERLVDFLCEVGEKREIYFLWRPLLRDPKDEMVLEVAVEAQADAIVTHNVRDFKGVQERFGIRIVTPGAFLLELEGEGE
jgi:putative PIN family toxin of toxin-antitoxin system